MSETRLSGPVFWLTSRSGDLGQIASVTRTRMITISMGVSLALAFIIVFFGAVGFALMVDDFHVKDLKSLFMPEFLAILVAAVPVGFVYGIINVRRLKIQLARQGKTLKDFGSMSAQQRHIALYGD